MSASGSPYKGLSYASMKHALSCSALNRYQDSDLLKLIFRPIRQGLNNFFQLT